jgi:hypothetical protein
MDKAKRDDTTGRERYLDTGGPPCDESQADGVPCEEMGADCEDCERADPIAREAYKARGEGSAQRR